MNANIKIQKFEELDNEFKLISEAVMLQFSCIEELLPEVFREKIFNNMTVNEKNINSLEEKIIEKIVRSVILFTPRAAELRKIVSYHETVLYIERIGDLLIEIAVFLKTTDLSLETFESYKDSLITLFAKTREMLGDALFSYSFGDKSVAYRTIPLEEEIYNIHQEIVEDLIVNFQDLELDEQDLVNIININNIASYMEKIANYASDIAKSAVYLAEGKNIKHKES